jgi:hypothetical protein
LTFKATVFPIGTCGVVPVFIGSEEFFDVKLPGPLIIEPVE